MADPEKEKLDRGRRRFLEKNVKTVSFVNRQFYLLRNGFFVFQNNLNLPTSLNKTIITNNEYDIELYGIVSHYRP
ncbi:hypothetical protein [Paenibacillus sp. Soil724D2]|uniref:hypothetical protein n=1 Tax=Paenibacillus sp. (strain Soil724D2) TaxID=1736392 RepID=UPI000712C391|nr:hypothetical protein [Paenibacillus sp. Soil724D2]KRE34318.1 hypothetical protein ASG85_13230 [Paenibacillus sp. Soil724D2]